MKEWWLTKGWPWLKENWWVLLLLPLMALVYLGFYFMNRPTIGLVEPLAAADERAKTEAETRARQLEEENARLQGQLSDLQKKYDDLEAQMEQRIEARVQELRDDPEKLRQAMLDAGRG